jgi:hypothetical protein
VFSALILRFWHCVYSFPHRRQIQYQMSFNDVFFRQLCFSDSATTFQRDLKILLQNIMITELKIA